MDLGSGSFRKLTGAMRVEPYLERIRFDGPREATAETLRRVHRAHMLAVPFENLDIHLGRPIVLSVPALYGKLVEQRRGGFCYELNGSFAWLVAALGFRVTLLSARVFAEGRWSEEFDHLALLVESDESGGPWLADVGFGDSFLEPLRFDPGKQTEQQGWRYAIAPAQDRWTLERRQGTGAWQPRYRFSLTPRRLEDFAPRCRWQQVSPESHFTQQTVCSRATERGRITLSGRRLVVTQGERRDERAVESAEEYRAILARDFGIDPAGLDVARLMSVG